MVTYGTTIACSALTFPHPLNCVVRKVLFNQWKVYGNTTNTSVGAVLLATIAMQVDAELTTWVNTGTEYAYYFVLPYDSFNSLDGDAYSDGITASTGYGYDTVASLIRTALKQSKAVIDEQVTTEFLKDEINACLRFISGKLKHWSPLQSFNYSLGYSQRGSYEFSMPTDIEDKNTNKSILDVRLGNLNTLIYQDKKEWINQQNKVAKTQVRTQATAGDTTLEIDNSYDFADSGTVKVYISGTQYTISYTGVTRSQTAGVLTGVPATGDGSITVTIAVDTNVWQNESEGIPTYFTVYEANLLIWPLPDSAHDNFNLSMDYYSQRTAVTTDSDVIEFPRYDAVKHWLIWKIRSTNNSAGSLDFEDGDYKMFNTILIDMIKKELTGQKYKWQPKINKITY